jgi:hypothetical protein
MFLPDIVHTYILVFAFLIVAIPGVFLVIHLLKITFSKSRGASVSDSVPDSLPQNSLESEAYEKALRILDDARIESLNIISRAKVFDKDVQDSMHHKIEGVSQRHAASLNDISGQLLAKYSALLRNEVGEFQEELRNAALQSQVDVGEQTRAEYEKMRQDVREYKKKRLAEIDAGIYRIIARALTDILGKTLSLEEHQDLVIKLLEDAKRRADFEI